MRAHKMKCWPQFFEDIISGKKTFEVRDDDRGYQEGDVLHLREYEPEDEAGYTGRERLYVVTYMTLIRCHGHVHNKAVMAITEHKPCNWKRKGIGSYFAIDKKDRMLARIWQVGEVPDDKWRAEVYGKHIDTFDEPHQAKLAAELEVFKKDNYDVEKRIVE